MRELKEKRIENIRNLYVRGSKLPNLVSKLFSSTSEYHAPDLVSDRFFLHIWYFQIAYNSTHKIIKTEFWKFVHFVFLSGPIFGSLSSLQPSFYQAAKSEWLRWLRSKNRITCWPRHVVPIVYWGRFDHWIVVVNIDQSHLKDIDLVIEPVRKWPKS